MEAPPLKTFLVVVTFLSMFAFLVMMIPPALLVEATEYREQTYPSYFDSLELTMFNETKNINFTYNNKILHSFKFGGHDMDFLEYYDGNRFYIRHYFWFLFIPHGYHHMKWKNDKGIDVHQKWGQVKNGWIMTKQTFDQNYDNETGIGKFTIYCSHLTMTGYIGFNTSLYSKPSEAWENQALSLLLCIGFDQIGTSWNVWSLISGILFFQAPLIHPAINAIIAIPLWVSIGWLIFAFVTAIAKALPFT